MQRRSFPLVALVAGLAACARQPAPPAPAAFAPAPGMPVYDGSVTVEPSTGMLDARWRIRFVADSATRDSVLFRLNEKLAVVRITGPDVARWTETRQKPGEWSNVVVHFTRSLPDGSPVVLDMATSGIPAFGGDGINRISTDWVELGLDAAWHPVFASFDQRLRGSMRLTLPSGWSAVASGDFDGPQLTSSVPLIDIAFSASPALRSSASGRNRVYHTGADAAVVARVLDATASCGRYLDARYAERESLPPVRIVLPPRGGPGYARQNYIVITDAAKQTPEGLARFVCHELSHFWSSGAVSSGPENWLNEAFAEYVAARYVRDVIGDSAYNPILRQWAEQGAGLPPIWTVDGRLRPSARIAYRKAPLLLHALEQRIGREAMDRFLARYMVRRIPRTTMLLDELRAVAGAEAADWLRAELGR